MGFNRLKEQLGALFERFFFRSRQQNNPDRLMRNLGYRFKDRALLEKALTHGSYREEHATNDNEILEFIGDALLQLVISHLLFERYPDCDEGYLTRFRAGLVNRKNLHKKGLELNLTDHVLVGSHMKNRNELERTSIISNCFEAVLGALFLDSDYRTSYLIIGKLFGEELDHLLATENCHVIDEKTQFFNYCRKKYKEYPSLSYTEYHGNPAEKRFLVKVRIVGQEIAEGWGKNKKSAVRNAIKNIENEKWEKQ